MGLTVKLGLGLANFLGQTIAKVVSSTLRGDK